MAKPPLDPDEERLALLLARCGLARPASRCLAAMMRGGAWRAGELAAATGLSSQDVSVGLRALASAGATVRDAAETASRGRPALRHRLAGDGSARGVLDALVARRRAELSAEETALDELAERARRLS